MKVPKGLMTEIRRKSKLPQSTLYWRIAKKRKDFGNMITEKQAACLLASHLEIDVAKYLDKAELRELRELKSKENFTHITPTKFEIAKEKPRVPKVSRRELVEKISPYDLDLAKYNLDEEILHDCGKLVSTKQYRPAIRETLLTLETRIRNTLELGEGIVGKDLINSAREKGVFARNVKSEEEGLYFLYRGAIQWLRNPPGHKKVKYTKDETIKIILFVDYLIKLFEKLVSTSQK